jgi:hypothetical protein
MIYFHETSLLVDQVSILALSADIKKPAAVERGGLQTTLVAEDRNHRQLTSGSLFTPGDALAPNHPERRRAAAADVAAVPVEPLESEVALRIERDLLKRE